MFIFCLSAYSNQSLYGLRNIYFKNSIGALFQFKFYYRFNPNHYLAFLKQKVHHKMWLIQYGWVFLEMCNFLHLAENTITGKKTKLFIRGGKVLAKQTKLEKVRGWHTTHRAGAKFFYFNNTVNIYGKLWHLDGFRVQTRSNFGQMRAPLPPLFFYSCAPDKSVKRVWWYGCFYISTKKLINHTATFIYKKNDIPSWVIFSIVLKQ